MTLTTATAILHVLLALAGAPLLGGITNRTKAKFAGRRGQPLLQGYYDLAKLFRKGATYSRTTTWVFRAGPIVGLAAVASALVMTPLGGTSSVLGFAGDALVLVYLLGLMRFATVLAAMDTGSAFEGMGASREVQFSMLAEPALLLALAGLAGATGEISLAGMYAHPLLAGAARSPALVLIAVSMLVVLLTENARIPVDDPNTHLELTMIHEVMVLDHGGPDLGFIQYAASLKLWVLGSLLVGLAWPVRLAHPLADLAAGLAGLAVLAVVVGVIESVMARLRLVRVPQLLVTASVLSLMAIIWILR